MSTAVCFLSLVDSICFLFVLLFCLTFVHEYLHVFLRPVVFVSLQRMQSRGAGASYRYAA